MDLSKTFDASSSSQQNVDYHKVAQQVLALKPRALTPTQFEDVLTLIEWMQGEVLKQHEANLKHEGVLAAREQEVTKREKELYIRARTVHVASGFKRKSYFWR